MLLGACAWQASAQPAFDSSGNGQLNGAYYMRQVFYFVNTSGALGEAMNLQGEITFNGAGGYTFTGTLLDSASGSATPVAVNGATGTYVVSASGEGYISAVNPDFPNDQIVGLVSHSVFIGSSTENITGYNDLFIAAPIGSVATNATLNGSYQAAYFDPTFPGDALFTMNANGAGNIGTVSVNGYVNSNSTASTENLTGVTYSFQNGGAQINFGGSSSSLIFGTEVLYITPDGNFIFGGSANGFDIFAGVRAASANPSNYNGLYYQVGFDLNSADGLDSYYGAADIFPSDSSVVDVPQGYGLTGIFHQRLNFDGSGSEDYTSSDFYVLNGDGTSDDFDFGQDYVSSTDGTIRVGYGLGPYLSMNVAFQGGAVVSASAGVYLDPVGVVNAASYAPFTAFASPGEFLTLYGSGLASTTSSSSAPFPNNLSGVQVLINQVPAPIYYVSPTQLEVVVPYITAPGSVARIQVINNGANSNVVTLFTGFTSAGAFTNPNNGLGYAAALHSDYSAVTESSPAQIGETVALYLAGMGAVSNQPLDGTAAPSSPLSYTTETPQVALMDSSGAETQANVTFSGLAPGFAGLYQINFTIPSGVAAGDAEVDIYSGLDSETFEALLPLSTATSAARPAALAKSPNRRSHLTRHRLPAGQFRFSSRATSSVDWRTNKR